MNRIKKKLLKVVKCAIRNKVVHEIDGFPPPCAGIWHQPKRPSNRKK